MAREGPLGIPRIESEKDLVHITDLVTALGVMVELKIDTNGVSDMVDALARIKDYFRREPTTDPSELDRVLKEAVSADRSNRQSLRELFEKANNYLQSLPAHFQTDLHHLFPNVYKTAEDTIQELQRNDCIIVVAGEKGAGKSSLVNLLAGCKILPTGMLYGTRTICELRHSETRKFVLHGLNTSGAPVVKVCHADKMIDRFLSELAHHVTCVDSVTEQSPYEKIEIYWPVPVAGEGVVIVDSPGVRESNKVSRQLEHYMSRAFGFIYVINISNAGGIRKDRLGQLLRQAAERGDQGFDPSTALFVCNWWDQVNPRVQDHVLHETLRRLSRVLPGVGRQQVFPLSSTESLRAVEKGYVLDEYRDLVQGIRQVLPVTFNVKLSSYYRWLSSVLKRSLYSLKISSTVAHKQVAQKEAAYFNVRNQIEALETKAEDQIVIMKHGFRAEVDIVTRKVLSFLKSEECVREMTSWIPSDCPATNMGSKKAVKDAAPKFRDKLATILDVWESQNNLVSKIKLNILKAYQRDLELFEDQVKRIEGVLFAGLDNNIVTELYNSLRRPMLVRNVWKKARKEKGKQPGDSGCFSLGSAISGCRNLDLKAAPVKNAFKNGSGPTAMAEVSKAFLQQYKDEEVASAIKKVFDRIAKRFDAASRLLPEFLKADRMLLEILQQEVVQEHGRLIGVYPSLIKTCTSLQGRLDMFFVHQLKSFNFEMEDLKYDADKPIGHGTFADVFRSCMSDGDNEVQVALKIHRNNLTEKSVTGVLQEDSILRGIRHENIICYYGAALKRQGSDLMWVIVLEYCPCTIKQRFISDEANVPGRQEIVSLQMDAMREVAHFASQICSALCYLHNKGIVHRDLKPDNILLTEDDVVRIADLGLARPVAEMTQGVVGTLAYMAPEIMLRSGRYGTAVDVYSLAIILWELWYGQDVAEHISCRLLGPIEDEIKNGLRPSVTMKNKPPDDWLRLLQSGWEFDAAKRPTSDDMADFFDNFLKENGV